MEVASGEHGECVPKLVTAVKNGKCNNYNQPLTHGGLANLTESVNGTISEILNHKSTNSNETVINMPSTSEKCCKSELNEEAKCCSRAEVTSALIESHKDLEKNEQKYTFPTTGWVQFYILIKRTFISIIRDKTLTQMRLLAHVIVGAIIGMIYYNIGNDATKM